MCKGRFLLKKNCRPAKNTDDNFQRTIHGTLGRLYAKPPLLLPYVFISALGYSIYSVLANSYFGHITLSCFLDIVDSFPHFWFCGRWGFSIIEIDIYAASQVAETHLKQSLAFQ